MKTKLLLFSGLTAVVPALILTTCLSLTGGTRAHTHQWSEWTQVSGDDATEERVCKADSAHRQTRLTGTDRFTFEAIGETAYRVSKGTLRTGEMIIPAYYRPDADSEYLPVTEIGNSSDSVSSNGAFNSTDITSVYISEGITIIHSFAFFGCASLVNITIPIGVMSIGYSAFCRCTSLKSITIPISVTSIDSYAFADCTSLASITIPADVTFIDSWAFSGTAWFNSQPDGLVYAGKILYTYKGTMPDNTVINNIRADTVAIAGNAFSMRTSLISITLPENITSIGDYAFSSCRNLESITISENITSIGELAFESCTNLTSITIPANVTFIGSWAFSNTTWLNSQPDGLVYTGKVLYTYKGAMPEKTVINNIRSNTIAISGCAFYECTNLTGIIIPDSVISIGERAFYECTSLINITLPVSVTSVSRGAFSFWTSSQTINIEGHTNQAAADAAWGSGWQRECRATINYLGH